MSGVDWGRFIRKTLWTISILTNCKRRQNIWLLGKRNYLHASNFLAFEYQSCKMFEIHYEVLVVTPAKKLFHVTFYLLCNILIEKSICQQMLIIPLAPWLKIDGPGDVCSLIAINLSAFTWLSITMHRATCKVLTQRVGIKFMTIGCTWFRSIALPSLGPCPVLSHHE